MPGYSEVFVTLDDPWTEDVHQLLVVLGNLHQDLDERDLCRWLEGMSHTLEGRQTLVTRAISLTSPKFMCPCIWDLQRPRFLCTLGCGIYGFLRFCTHRSGIYGIST